MTKINFTTILFLFLLCTSQLFGQDVKTGIEVLMDNDFDVLKGKKIGLITNPTGVDRNLVSTIDILHQAKGVKLISLFGPEHGVRGDIHAGDKISSSMDAKTCLPIHSLYGTTKKPTAEMLKNIDVLVYDIQDIGCRSFTYISTMGLLMEIAAENDLELVVLDRPNPLGGEKVEGNLVREAYISFVSKFKIPYIYGLTCGELALMLNGERMLGKKCKLTVVPMEGWKRNMSYVDTKLPWVLPSPHIPQAETSYYYPATGILGELGFTSIGIGYTLPFQLLAAEWIDAAKFADAMNALKLPGWEFRPLYIKPFYGLGKGKTLQGVQLHITDKTVVKLTEPQFYAIQVLAELYPNRLLRDTANKGRYNMFDKVCGSNYIREIFFRRHKFEDIKEYWYKDVEPFRKLSKKYYLYK